MRSFVPGWKLVKNLDGHTLDRKVSETGWTFFFEAGEIKATVFGIDTQHMARRAIERILRDPRSKKFNSLEVMQVAQWALNGSRESAFSQSGPMCGISRRAWFFSTLRTLRSPERKQMWPGNANGRDSRPN